MSNWVLLSVILKIFTKVFPQGSILGTVIFNIFINDIFYFITDSDLRNYAEDNTVTYAHSDPQVVKSVLTKDSIKGVDWFSDNRMKANPAVAAGLKSKNENCSFDLGKVMGVLFIVRMK